jgi:hypothetical protein
MYWLIYTISNNKKRNKIKLLYENMLTTYVSMADDIFGNNKANNPSIQDYMFEIVDSNKYQVNELEDVPMAKTYYSKKNEEKKIVTNIKYVKTEVEQEKELALFEEYKKTYLSPKQISTSKIKLEKRKNLKLKGINTDEKGFSNFYTSTIEPSYSFDIYENNNNEFILEVQAELYGNINPNEINYNKERITDNFYITITGKLQSENMNYHPKGNLKFNEFSIQIKLESEILFSNTKLLIKELDEKPKDIQYDDKYAITTFLFGLTAEYIDNVGGGHGVIEL